MKTYKQLINEYTRVRQSKVDFDSGVKTARFTGSPQGMENPHTNAGYRTARDMGSGLPADQGGDGSMGSGKGQDALKFTRKERVTATEKMAARARLRKRGWVMEPNGKCHLIDPTTFVLPEGWIRGMKRYEDTYKGRMKKTAKNNNGNATLDMLF